MEEQEMGFREILFFIWKKKILGLIIAVITFGMAFGFFAYKSYNSNEYICDFRIDWSGRENGVYPNGQVFGYEQMISLDNLLDIKENNEKLSSVDVQKMVENDDIAIGVIYTKVNKDDSDSGFNTTYSISVKQKYFKNSEQATIFMKEIIETQTYNNVVKQISDYQITDYFKNQTNSSEYIELIDNIDSQINMLKTTIKSLTQKTSANYVYDQETNDTLGDLSLEFETYLANNTHSHFYYEMQLNGYVRNLDTYQDELKKKEFSLKYEKEMNDKKIAALSTIPEGVTGGGQDNVAQLMSQFKLRNVEIEVELNYIQSALENKAFNKEFDDSVIDYQNRLLSFKTEVEEAYSAVYLEKTKLYYSTSNIVVGSGNGLIMNGLISCAIGVAVALGILFAMAMMNPNNLQENLEKAKNKKEEKSND